MSDYDQISRQVINLVGGAENIVSSYYCTTRLRLKLMDKSKADVAKIAEIEGIYGCKDQQGEIQVIIGPDVDKMHKVFLTYCPNKEEVNVEEIAAAEKRARDSKNKENAFNRITSFIAGIFIPIVPCLAGESFRLFCRHLFILDGFLINQKPIRFLT